MEQEYQMNAVQDMIIKFEYVWLDGDKTKNIRMKTRYENWKLDMSNSAGFSREEILRRAPVWSFDGSSTGQAKTEESDLYLHPVKIYHNPLEQSEMASFIVLCDVRDRSGNPVGTNTRSDLIKALSNTKEEELQFSVEQEYFIRNAKTQNVVGLDSNSEPQGRYYCGVGSNLVDSTCRRISELHAETCHQTRIPFFGTNAEVAPGQWEYQLYHQDPLDAADDLWISRYFLMRVAETFDYYIDLKPKPVKGDWNGSGAHINFSTKETREAGSAKLCATICEALRSSHKNHIDKYGDGNEERLTGEHETQDIKKFTWGAGDRGASIRVPAETISNGWNGYYEDRRPGANVDPYEAFTVLIRTLDNAKTLEEVS